MKIRNQRYVFRLDKAMLATKIKSATNAKLDDTLYPRETLYHVINKSQFMLNMGKLIILAVFDKSHIFN